MATACKSRTPATSPPSRVSDSRADAPTKRIACAFALDRGRLRMRSARSYLGPSWRAACSASASLKGSGDLVGCRRLVRESSGRNPSRLEDTATANLEPHSPDTITGTRDGRSSSSDGGAGPSRLSKTRAKRAMAVARLTSLPHGSSNLRVSCPTLALHAAAESRPRGFTDTEVVHEAQACHRRQLRRGRRTSGRRRGAPGATESNRPIRWSDADCRWTLAPRLKRQRNDPGVHS